MLDDLKEYVHRTNLERINQLKDSYKVGDLSPVEEEELFQLLDSYNMHMLMLQ